jgi:hypothetical protein
MNKITQALNLAKAFGSLSIGIRTLQSMGATKTLRSMGKKIWRFAKSEDAIAIIQVAAALAAFIHAVEQYRKVNRKIGFKP